MPAAWKSHFRNHWWPAKQAPPENRAGRREKGHGFSLKLVAARHRFTGTHRAKKDRRTSRFVQGGCYEDVPLPTLAAHNLPVRAMIVSPSPEESAMSAHSRRCCARRTRSLSPHLVS